MKMKYYVSVCIIAISSILLLKPIHLLAYASQNTSEISKISEISDTSFTSEISETKNPLRLYDTTLENSNNLLNLLNSNNFDCEQIQNNTVIKNLKDVLSNAKKTKSKYKLDGVPTVSNQLMIYKKNTIESSKIGILPKGSIFKVLKECRDGWTKIESNNVIGFVKTEYIATSFDMEQYIKENKEDFNKIARVNVKNLYARKSCNIKNNNIVETLGYDDKLTVIGENKDWVKVECEDNESGYVKKDCVDVSIDFKEAIDLEEKRKDELRNEIVEYAESFVGRVPYIWGGADLNVGVDCSGFVQQVYKEFGYNISRTSREQAFDGETINIEDVKKGDLLFYINPETGNIGHVTMYIGDNQLVHASNPKDGIKISNIWYRDFCKVVRVIK